MRESGNALSSRSAKRLWVNFQTKNAITPMRATPPATERPMMVEVDVPLLPELLLSAAELELDEADDADPDGVYVTKTTDVSVWPSAFVVMICEDSVVGWGGFVVCWLLAVVVCEVWVFDCWLLADVVVCVGVVCVVWVLVLALVLVVAVVVWVFAAVVVWVSAVVVCVVAAEVVVVVASVVEVPSAVLVFVSVLEVSLVTPPRSCLG